MNISCCSWVLLGLWARGRLGSEIYRCLWVRYGIEMEKRRLRVAELFWRIRGLVGLVWGWTYGEGGVELGT